DEKSDGKSNDAEWSARVGIARAKCGHADLALLEAGLRTDDVSLRKQVILAMGECRDPKAVAMLLDQLTTVLERAEVVEALGKAGSASAAPALQRILREDPYVHVRAQAAHALAQIEGRRAVPTLRAALAREKEEPVRAALLAEIDRLKTS